jgi:hypothetical protein
LQSCEGLKEKGREKKGSKKAKKKKKEKGIQYGGLPRQVENQLFPETSLQAPWHIVSHRGDSQHSFLKNKNGRKTTKDWNFHGIFKELPM